jgi:hypothetical protein
MSTTLTRDPLRMSPMMFTLDEDTLDARVAEGPQPLAYLYANWDPEPEGEFEPFEGFYDPDSQTWIQTSGPITAGHWTTCNPPRHQVIDDACA